jgi:hypothetical protein
MKAMLDQLAALPASASRTSEPSVVKSANRRQVHACALPVTRLRGITRRW